MEKRNKYFNLYFIFRSVSICLGIFRFLDDFIGISHISQGVAVGLGYAATAWRGFGRSSCPRRCHWVRICCHCVAGILLYPRRCRWVRVCCHCVAGVRTFILPKALPLGWGMLPLRGGVQTFILPKALPLG